MFCNNCGKELPADANFCFHCGEKVIKLDNKKKCSCCGIELADGARFCYKCGNPVEETAVFAEQQKLECSECGKTFDFDMVFCDACGNKLEKQNDSASEADLSESPSSVSPKITITHNVPSQKSQELLLKLGLTERYEGEHALVNFKGFGKLMLYGDRIEFVSKSQQKEYFYKDIQSYSFGSFVLEKTLVLNLKNGAVESFAGGLWSNETQEQLKAVLSERVK